MFFWFGVFKVFFGCGRRCFLNGLVWFRWVLLVRFGEFSLFGF